MNIEFDPLDPIRKHYAKHREAYIVGLLGFAVGMMVRRPIVIQNIVQR